MPTRLLAWSYPVALPLVLAGSEERISAPRELPAAVRAQLTASYPGWRFARILPALRNELESDGPRRSVEWVTADFDGDRRQDYAVQIVRAGSADSAQLVVAFLGRERGRYEMSVAHTGSEHLGQILTTEKRGERVRNYDAVETADSMFVLTNDAVVILINEGAAITCVYEKRNWRCVQSAD